jgi:hypothetical protein
MTNLVVGMGIHQIQALQKKICSEKRGESLRWRESIKYFGPQPYLLQNVFLPLLSLKLIMMTQEIWMVNFHH